MIRQLLSPLALAAVFSLPIHAAQESTADDLVADDIYLAGGFVAATDEPFVLNRSALIALPGFDQIKAKIVPGNDPATLGVIPFSKLLQTFPLADGYDGLVLETHNGWESFLTVDYLNKKTPSSSSITTVRAHPNPSGLGLAAISNRWLRSTLSIPTSRFLASSTRLNTA